MSCRNSLGSEYRAGLSLRVERHSVFVGHSYLFSFQNVTKKLISLTFLSRQQLAAVSYDAVQTINKAVNIEPCSSINGSDIGPEATKAMLTCLRMVKNVWIVSISLLSHFYGTI